MTCATGCGKPGSSNELSDKGDALISVNGVELGEGNRIKALEERIRILEEEVENLKEGPRGFYQKLRQARDVNVLVVGDSIGLGSGVAKEEAWPCLLQDWMHRNYYGECSLTNCSLGGNTSYAGYVQVRNLEDNPEYDLAIVCFGENDSEDVFSVEYEAVLREIRRKFPMCSIICLEESSQRDYTRKIQEIAALAAHYGIPVADTIKAFKDSGKAYESLVLDQKHPNEDGHEIYFQVLRDIIASKAEGYEAYEPRDVEPVNQEVLKFDSSYYIAREQWQRRDERTWEISVNGNLSGSVGMDQTYQPGEGEVSISLDQEVQEIKLDWPYDFSQRIIGEIIKEPCRVSKSIRMEFSSPELADGFQGLIFIGTIS